MTHIDDYCIQVTRSDTGYYNIPGGAQPEDWETVKAGMLEVEDHGALLGWERWERIYRCVDEDEGERWYFVSDRPLCSHCISAGQDESEAGLAEAWAYWINSDGVVSADEHHICRECYDAASHGTGPGYVSRGAKGL